MGFSLKKVAKSIGNLVKGNTGGAIGAAVGSLIPGVGTAIGYTIGSGLQAMGSSSSKSSAKAQAKYNQQLQYKYQTMLNQQGYTHDTDMLGRQQAYDQMMANTAVQRRKADLLAADINPIHAADTDAGGGGLGGGSGLGGGNAQSSQADWVGLRLQQLAAERDEQRVAIEQANSASSGALMAAQEQNTLAEMAKTVAELPYVGKRQESEINNIIAGTVKSKAETAKSIADTEKLQQGLLGNILGTENYKKLPQWALPAIATAVPGIGLGIKAYKGAKTAKGFVNFLKSVK